VAIQRELAARPNAFLPDLAASPEIWQMRPLRFGGRTRTRS
jgi:hypothetical protein